VASLVKNFPAMYGTCKVHYHDHKAHHWTESWATGIQSTSSQPISLPRILILSSHPCGLQTGLFLSHSPIRSLHAFLITSMRTTRPYHPNFFELIIPITLYKRYKLWSSSFCNCLHPPIISCFQDHNILLSTWSQTPSVDVIPFKRQIVSALQRPTSWCY
jgi:hypothetical protein